MESLEEILRDIVRLGEKLDPLVRGISQLADLLEQEELSEGDALPLVQAIGMVSTSIPNVAGCLKEKCLRACWRMTPEGLDDETVQQLPLPIGEDG